MKKLFMAVVLTCSTLITLHAQTSLPYAKMLSLTKEQLKEGKFKYDDYRNQYVLRKGNGWNSAANIINALGGVSADIKPHPDDYQITIQNGADGQVAWIDVLFYKDETYHQLLTWAQDIRYRPARNHLRETDQTAIQLRKLQSRIEPVRQRRTNNYTEHVRRSKNP